MPQSFYLDSSLSTRLEYRRSRPRFGDFGSSCRHFQAIHRTTRVRSQCVTDFCLTATTLFHKLEFSVPTSLKLLFWTWFLQQDKSNQQYKRRIRSSRSSKSVTHRLITTTRNLRQARQGHGACTMHIQPLTSSRPGVDHRSVSIGGTQKRYHLLRYPSAETVE